MHGASSPRPRSRCVSRDLGWPAKALDAARATLEAHGDRANAAHAGNLEARRLLLLGRLDDAGRTLAAIDVRGLPPALIAGHELVAAGIAIRRLKTKPARAALAAGRGRGPGSGYPGAHRGGGGSGPGPRHDGGKGDRRRRGTPAPVSARWRRFSRPGVLVVDACRNVVREAGTLVSLATRPVLFALARALAEAWPDDVPRSTLLARAFGAKHADELHRARLRVEVGRLRAELRPLAEGDARRSRASCLRHRTGARSWCWRRRSTRSMRRCSPSSPTASRGRARRWRSRSGASPRTVQRALGELAATGKVQWFGRGRARRWMTLPVPGFPTALLLPGPLPGD